ncbi:MAG: dephospho-CoA kinase [Eubacteriales bacterium]|nr:dephospho-CoA kinase [Eubacteriales bacterium]
MIIGLTGFIGSGKTIASKYISKKLDYPIFICDDIAKEIENRREIKNKINEIKKKYNRTDLKEIFIDINFKTEIEEIIHKETWNELKKYAKNNKNFIIETALPSNEFFNNTNFSIYIYSFKKNIIDRLIKYRNYSLDKINKILFYQNEYKKFYEKCDFIIENNNNIEYLKEKIDEICINRIGLKW